jgi:hypothetical protein
MAVSPEDLAAGTLALQAFIKNSQYVEMIVTVAFGAIPTVLGIGAAGLLGSGVINTARDVMHSISLIRMVGPTMQLGGEVTGQIGKGLGMARDMLAERVPVLTRIPYIGPRIFKPPNKKGGDNQNTQSKQEEQGGGGSGGSPPSPPNIKPSDKKEEQAKISGIPIDEYIKKKGMS